MFSFDRIRARVSPSLRKVFDGLWEEFLNTGKWPLDRVVYAGTSKSKLLKLFEPIDGTFVVEYESAGKSYFHLQQLGVLCTSRGGVYLDWLRRYVALARDIFYGNPDKGNITRADAKTALELSEDEATELGRLLEVGLLWTQPGHAPDFSTWEAILPKGLEDIPPNASIERGFQRMLARHHYPKMEIWADARARALAAASPLLDAFSETHVGGARTKRRRSTRRRAPTSVDVEKGVLVKSRRRCCVCFGWDGDLSTKPGQIAHLDGNRSNSSADNLAWLCLIHHDQLDSRTSQSKGLTIAEVKHYRGMLWQAIRRNAHFRK